MEADVFTRLEQASSLDRVGDPAQRAVQSVVRPRALEDLLHGVWLGHPLHPIMVQAPLGAWLSAAMLDLVPGQRRAATFLVGAGIATAVPAALAGAADWASLAREQRRVGLVHALANTTALGLYVASLAARLRGRHGRGRLLGFAALSAAGLGGFLGGHLSYRQGAGVNHSAPSLRRIPAGWHRLGPVTGFPPRVPVVRHLGEVRVLVFRDGSDVSVLLENCAHQNGPLGEGELTEVGGDVCVTCPWHGSVFRLADGAVRRGPAASNQPALRVRVVDGELETSLP